MWQPSFNNTTAMETNAIDSEPMSARELEGRRLEIPKHALRTKRVVVSKHGDTSIYFEQDHSKSRTIQMQSSETANQTFSHVPKNLVKSFPRHDNDENSPPRFRHRTVTTSVSALRVRAEERLSRLERLQAIHFPLKI